MEIAKLKQKFIDIYGAGGEIRVFQAAGRVNLIGEHIDYNGGKVFPAALSLRCLVLARKTTDSKIKLAATTIDDRVTLDIDRLNDYRGLKWGAYQAGVAYTMQAAGYGIQACELLYDCTVPFGSGLSSSAAIEVATAITLGTFSTEAGNPKPWTPIDLAVLSQKAENEYAGVNCGIMDQFASSLGRRANAVLLDTATLDYRYVPLELGDYKLILGNTKYPRSLQDSKYNERRAECEEGLKALQTVLPGLRNLGAVTPEQFAAHKSILPAVIRKRVEHVVYECRRVEDSVAALERGDLAVFGQLLNQSHASLRDLYEVTGKELDSLAHHAQRFSGCLGSRMTGAGFGGCTVSIVHEDRVADFIREVGGAYTRDTGRTGEFYAADIADGAKEVRE